MLALLIIDQQIGIDSPTLGARNNPKAQATILQLLAQWRHRQWPIFHIRHRSLDASSVFWPHQTGFAFKPEFEPRAGENIIEKSVPCAFINNSLRHQLKQFSHRGLVITGAATNNSVESTARTAGNYGYNNFVIEDACFTFDKVDHDGVLRSAAQVHAMSLANLDQEYSQVIHSEQLLATIESLHKENIYDPS